MRQPQKRRSNNYTNYSNKNKRRKRTAQARRYVSPYRMNQPKTTVKRKLNKKKVLSTFIIFVLLIVGFVKATKRDKIEQTSSEANEQTSIANEVNRVPEESESVPETKIKKEITDWRLTLVNYENILPEDFEVEVADIDDTRQFDARAIKELKKMINDMGHDGISNIWIQSAYRSVARQKELYDNSIQKYLKQGKSQEEAERLTDEYINKPGSSDHNLGLAVDFNNVDNKFEDLEGFKWLKKNAENYGFILRYPKDKEEITKISYESWHWRYVGVEHAKKMNELNMCLEEYVEYLQYEDVQ